MPTLHLGCGLDYRPSAINIDRYDLTAADLQADVLCLPFPAGSVSRIEANQVVEHLGYAGTLYALAEWWRVLAPGGALLVETPDRPAACLAAAEPDAPAPALHWLFGLALPGYEHRTLFDESELRALAKASSFSAVEITRHNASQPTLRLAACKTRDKLADLWARLHASFVAAGIVDPIAAPPHLAHLETICDRVVAAAAGLPKVGAKACLATALGATARHDARVAEAALKVLVALEMVPAEAAAPYLGLACSLVKEAFPARLAAYLRQNPSPPGTQAVHLRRLDDLLSLYLTVRLRPDETALQPAREAFDAATDSLTPADREITFFCAESVASLSQRETARGVRAFAQGDLEAARVHLECAITYDADNPLPVWNLARLALVEDHHLEALAHYAALLELLPGAVDSLRAEMDAATGREPEALASFLGSAGGEVVP
jgi:SAM-dependent methyltransferase